MSTKLFENEMGISNLIATLLLIAVAVVGGGFAYTAFMNQASSATTSADLQVQDISAVKPGTTTQLSITVKNVGTQRLSNIIVDMGGNQLNVGDLDPGQTGSASGTDSTVSLNAGETYAVQITADTPDSGSITKTMTVRVRS